MSDILRFGVQKSGRLHDDSIKLLEACGIKFNKNNNRLKEAASNFPLEFLFLRDDDIPGYVADGVVDVGIVGMNVVAEQSPDVEITDYLGFATCRLSIAVPKSFDYQNVNNLSGLRIATSYPNILTKFLEANKVQAEIHMISGSVEIAPSIGLADAICDLVSSGSTLISNGLKEAETVMRSEAVLVAFRDMTEAKRVILESLRFRMRSVMQARNYKYIMLNAPASALASISGILPGIKAPTVMPLSEEGWISVHSVIQEHQFWQIIEDLQHAGAEGILVLPIEKMIN